MTDSSTDPRTQPRYAAAETARAIHTNFYQNKVRRQAHGFQETHLPTLKTRVLRPLLGS